MRINEIKNLIVDALSTRALDYWVNTLDWYHHIDMFERYHFDDGLTKIESRDAVVKEIELLALPHLEQLENGE